MERNLFRDIFAVGNEHFTENEILKESSTGVTSYEDIRIYTEELQSAFP